MFSSFSDLNFKNTNSHVDFYILNSKSDKYCEYHDDQRNMEMNDVANDLVGKYDLNLRTQAFETFY